MPIAANQATPFARSPSSLAPRKAREAAPLQPEPPEPVVSPSAEAVAEFAVVERDVARARADLADATKRALATRALDAFVAAYAGRAEIAGELRVEAAYQSAALRKDAGDPAFRAGYRATIAAFSELRAATTRPGFRDETYGSRAADHGAEAAFFFVDERIRDEWETPPGRFAYVGNYDDVEPHLVSDIQVREAFFAELEKIRGTYGSRRHLPILLAREATLYDVQRDALLQSNIQPSAKMLQKLAEIQAKCKAIIADPNSSDRAKELCTETLRNMQGLPTLIANRWARELGGYLHDAEVRLTQRSAAAWLRAMPVDVLDPRVARAAKRLSSLTRQLGDDGMRRLLEPTRGTAEAYEWSSAYSLRFTYVDGMFL